MADEFARFVYARLDEEVALARAASPGPWHVSEEFNEVLAADGTTVANKFAPGSEKLRATAEYIAHNDPPSALFELGLKRQLVDRAAQTRAWAVGEAGAIAGPAVILANGILRLIALPYADHPDYREEWKP